MFKSCTTINFISDLLLFPTYYFTFLTFSLGTEHVGHSHHSP